MSHFLSIGLIFSLLFSDDLVRINVTDEISMKIPADFRLMTDDELAARYFTTKRPVAMYTDQALNVDLGINRSTTQWIVDDLEIMVSFQKANIYSLYDEVEMISQGVREVNGHKAAYFEFESLIKSDENSIRAKGAVKKYTYIQYMIVGETSWVFNFSSPVQLRSQWQPLLLEIMGSVEFVKKKK